VISYAEALERLFQLRRFGIRPGLDGIRTALARVGDPQRALRFVHLAGTNGKGSTAAFTESVLRAAGLRTGLYTSPHLHRFTERIRIDGRELAQAEAAALAERVLAATPEATFFEVATVMAFLAFAARAVDVVVLEAGLGGRLDSTNVIDAPLVSVVTGVALDHTDVLGGTLAEIAREKTGICRAGVPAVLACEDDDTRAILEAEARRHGAEPYLFGRELDASPSGDGLRYRGPGGALDCDRLGLAGAHQARNAALALAAVALAAERAGWSISDDARRRGLTNARWPGRLERIAEDVLIDAAHNPDGARALARSLPPLAAGREVALVFGVVSDKNAADMLAPLLPLAARVIFTRPASPRARDPEELRALCPGAAVLPSVADALAAARRDGRLAVVAGSIFLIAEARRLVLGEPSDPIVVQDPMPQKL
jgi:dihydrofolate synthase/folylpolyglutamate synthase